MVTQKWKFDRDRVENIIGKGENAGYPLFSLPDKEVLRVSYCDSAVSVGNFLAYVRSRGLIFSSIIMKLGQDVCLDEILDKSEKGSMSGQRQGH